MTRLILFDPDLNHAECVKSSLRAATFEIAVCRDLAETLRALGSAVFDILILASCNAQECRHNIDLIQRMIGGKPSSPQIIWLSPTYRGPEERLEIERKGVRLVYERAHATA